MLNKTHANILIAASLLFTCCSLPEIKKTSPEINELAANSKFCVILPENHSTGYLWQLSQDFNKTVVSHINEVWHGNEKGIYFNLRSQSAGQTTLTFVCRKYTDTSDIKRFIVKITPQ